MAEQPISRSTYLRKHTGEYAAHLEVGGRQYVKVDDLRYGTNPGQTAAWYKPADRV